MTNTYKATSVIGAHYYGEGVTEHDLSAADEQDAVNSGHLEIVPRKYRVLSDNYSAGEQGSEFEAAYPVEIEQALIQGGHIERVADKSEEEEGGGDSDVDSDEPSSKEVKPRAKKAAEPSAS